jgi:hypothetical protein
MGRFSRLGFAVFAASLGLAAGALAQSFPTHFAPRCQPEQLRLGMSQDPSQDPCAPQIAIFGLNGPAVIGARTLDVETTGSLASGRAAGGPMDERSGARK